ncbi:MAG: M50 family metallopeptidase [Candidatus Thiodiazotropha sp.]
MSSGKAVFLVELTLVLLLKAVPLLHLPFDWFQTFFHELSHGIAALLTGGRIQSIEIAADGSGRCTTLGGISQLILFSGYTGSSLWGLLSYLSVSAKSAKTIALSLGAGVVLVGVLWVRDWQTVLILITITALFLFAYRFGNRKLTQHFVAFTGLYVVVESLRAPFYLVDGQSVGDGGMLARLTGVPEFVWIGIWALIALGALVLLYTGVFGRR